VCSLLVTALCRLGSEELKERGNTAAAIAVYEEALLLHPTNDGSLKGIATAEIRHGIGNQLNILICSLMTLAYPSERFSSFQQFLYQRNLIMNLPGGQLISPNECWCYE
jgi:hypothetical protein